MKKWNAAIVCGIVAAAASQALAQGAAPAAQSKPAAASSSEAPTQATSEGALKLFITHIKAGDFKKVVELSDPGAEAYQDFVDMAEQLDPATANPKVEPQMLEMVRGMFTKPWQDVEHTLVTEQGPRAQYKLTFFGVDPKTTKRVEIGTRTVDLNKADEKWRVIITQTLLQPASGPQAAPTPAPAPATKPANEGAKPAGQ